MAEFVIPLWNVRKDEDKWGQETHPGACGNQYMVLSGNYGKTLSSLRRKKGKFILMSGDS